MSRCKLMLDLVCFTKSVEMLSSTIKLSCTCHRVKIN